MIPIGTNPPGARAATRGLPRLTPRSYLVSRLTRGAVVGKQQHPLGVL